MALANRLPSLFALVGLALILALTGCQSPPLPEPQSNQPAALSLPDQPIRLPAQLVGSHFIVEVARPRGEPWHFLIDTGSSVTLVSPDFARRHALSSRKFTHAPKRVRTATGMDATLDSVLLKELNLGGAVFRSIPALVFDPGEISAHLGVKIDGILGFPFFKGTFFSLDYPAQQLALARPPEVPLSDSFGYLERYRTPRIGIRVGTTSMEALLDSGSDSALVLPSRDADLPLATELREGGTIGGLVGAVHSQVARLGIDLELGQLRFPTPIVTIGAPHVALGADLFRHLIVSFDTTRQQVSFSSPGGALPPAEPLRHTGLSFDKSPAYWRIEAVLAGSPAERLGLRVGDLVVRIEGEPVNQWPLDRFLKAVNAKETLVFTLLHGSKERPLVVKTFELVPVGPGSSPFAPGKNE